MNVLVDTGVWYAFCDIRDHPNDRQDIERLAKALQFARVLLPWPVVYETVRTRLSRSKTALERLEFFLDSLDVEFIDDDRYRRNALRLVFETSLRRRPPRPLSMIDCLLRLMLEDASLKIDRFATYNERDFRDVCTGMRIEMVR